ncbi:hypothetical protein INR49_028875 [Caranx melampygus]|nr:hypothetical protein INR49_028875 [Caranx melampygus]
MAMKRLSNLMLKKWKEKERWTGRRRSEPYIVGEEEEEEEDRQRDRRGRQMQRRRSEPCGHTEEDQKMQEKKKKTNWKKERRKSESNMEEEDKNDRRRMEMGRGKERRKSASWMMVEDRAGGQTDKKQRETDGRTLRRRSEPCGILYVQLLPLSNRKRKELLQRRTGCKMSCSKEEEEQMTGDTLDHINPLDNTQSMYSPSHPPPRQEEVSVFRLETYLTEPRRPETRRLRSFSSPPDTGQCTSPSSSQSQLPPVALSLLPGGCCCGSGGLSHRYQPETERRVQEPSAHRLTKSFSPDGGTRWSLEVSVPGQTPDSRRQRREETEQREREKAR